MVPLLVAEVTILGKEWKENLESIVSLSLLDKPGRNGIRIYSGKHCFSISFEQTSKAWNKDLSSVELSVLGSLKLPRINPYTRVCFPWCVFYYFLIGKILKIR